VREYLYVLWTYSYPISRRTLFVGKRLDFPSLKYNCKCLQSVDAYGIRALSCDENECVYPVLVQWQLQQPQWSPPVPNRRFSAGKVEFGVNPSFPSTRSKKRLESRIVQFHE
jgi:hypothetical protein